LARIKIDRKLTMPTASILHVLPGVERLDVCFLFLEHAAEDP